MKKYDFGKFELKYLGYIVHSGKLLMDQEKFIAYERLACSYKHQGIAIILWICQLI